MLEFHKFGNSCLDCFIRIYKNQVWLTSSKWSLLVHAADVLWVGDEGKVRPLLRAIVSLMVEKIVQKKRPGQVLHILQLKKRRILSKNRASSCRESPHWGWLWLMVSKMGKERLEWLAGQKVGGEPLVRRDHRERDTTQPLLVPRQPDWQGDRFWASAFTDRRTVHSERGTH